jgi:hypothetical protein
VRLQVSALRMQQTQLGGCNLTFQLSNADACTVAFWVRLSLRGVTASMHEAADTDAAKAASR